MYLTEGPDFKSILSPIYLALTTALASLLIACGGGSSAGSSPKIVAPSEVASDQYERNYAGQKHPAQISVSNAVEIASKTILALDLIELFSSYNGENHYIRHFLTGGDFSSSDSSSACNDGGHLSVSDMTDTQGIGLIEYKHVNCLDEGVSTDGKVKLVISSDLKTKVKARIQLDGFKFQFSGVESENEDIELYGNIVTEFDVNIAPVNNTLWTANLLVELPESGRQLYFDNFVRTNDLSFYEVLGKMFISDIGFVELVMDSSNNILEMKGAESNELTLAYSLDNTKSSLYEFPTSSLELTLGSSAENIPYKTLSFTPAKLLLHKTYDQKADITWGDNTSAFKNESITLEPVITDNDSFLEVNWSAPESHNGCQIESHGGPLVFEVFSPCTGDLSVNVSVFDGTTIFDHQYDLRFKKLLPQVSYQAPEYPLGAGEHLSLVPNIENPEEGHFVFELASGIEGSTVTSSGNMEWMINPEFPNLFSQQVHHYSVAVTNEDTAFSQIDIAVDFHEHEPTISVPYQPEADERYYISGGIDISPGHATGDIGFIAHTIQGPASFIKLDKESMEIREIQSLGNFSRLHHEDSYSKQSAYHDWNKDGVVDLVYSNLEKSGESHTVYLNVLDMKSETSLYRKALFSIQDSLGVRDAYIRNIHFADFNQDGAQELLFGFETDWHASSEITGLPVTPGMFVFDLGTESLFQLATEHGYFTTADLDQDDVPEILDLYPDKLNSYRLDWNQKTLVTTDSTSIDPVHTIYREPIFAHTITTEVSQDLAILFSGDEIQCRLEIIRARVNNDTLLGAESPYCRDSYMKFDKELNLIKNRELRLISYRAPFAPVQVNNSSISNYVLLNTRKPVDNTSVIAGFDMSSGNYLWSKVFDDALIFGLSSSYFADKYGNEQMAIGSMNHIYVTQ